MTKNKGSNSPYESGYQELMDKLEVPSDAEWLKLAERVKESFEEEEQFLERQKKNDRTGYSS